QRVLRLHPGDRLVRHVYREVVVEAVRLLHAYRSIEDRRRPLVGLAADEAVELVEPRMGRPAIVGARDRDFPGWRLVVLAEGSRAVPVESQHLRERRDALRPDAGIAGERGGQLHDGARVVDVVIAAGQERRARRGAKRRRVEIVETQAAGRQLVQSRHLDRAAEGARLAEADVVQRTTTTFGAAWGAFTSKRAGGLTSRALSSVTTGGCGSGIGRTVRSTCCATASWLAHRAVRAATRVKVREIRYFMITSVRWTPACVGFGFIDQAILHEADDQCRGQETMS